MNSFNAQILHMSGSSIQTAHGREKVTAQVQTLAAATENLPEGHVESRGEIHVEEPLSL